MSCRRATAIGSSMLLLLMMVSVLQAPGARAESGARGRLLTQKLQLLDVLLTRTRSHPELSSDDRSTLDVAETLTHVARQDLQETDLDAVNMSLDEALRLIGEVSRQYAARAPGADRSDYENLRATVDGLHEAFGATIATRNGAVPKDLDPAALEAGLARSADLAARGRFADATRILREVYTSLVNALAALRASETVAHRLVFEAPKDELDYELNRLRSNELLVQLMVQEKKPAPSVLIQVEADVAEAARFKALSNAQGASNDFTGALHSAEAANGHLVRALRRIGVYIPQY